MSFFTKATLLFACLMINSAHARVTKIQIDQVQLLPENMSGGVATEQIAGRAFGELDPKSPMNSLINDIQYVKDADGKVRYVATFVITKPVNAKQASGLMWHEVPNRGNPRPNVPAERKNGDIDLTSAWQGDNSGATTVRESAAVDKPHWLKLPIARQADGTVIATLGETSVMANVTFAKSQKPGQDFFPLTVHYNEKYYAAGKIPGGFFKREARPTEKETLTSRLIDRPIRPLFVPGFKNEVLVICTVLSHDLVNDPDMVAMIAASAALTISGAPFMGPIAGARVGFVDGEYVLNPTIDDMHDAVYLEEGARA